MKMPFLVGTFGVIGGGALALTATAIWVQSLLPTLGIGEMTRLFDPSEVGALPLGVAGRTKWSSLTAFFLLLSSF